MKKCQQCGTEVLHQEQHQDAKSKASLEILHCHHCGLIQQAHIPTEDELKIYYSHHYRTDYKSVYQPKIKYVRRAGLAALDRVHFLEKHLGKIHGQQLIDIGAGGAVVLGMGSLDDGARQLYWGTRGECVGVGVLLGLVFCFGGFDFLAVGVRVVAMDGGDEAAFL